MDALQCRTQRQRQMIAQPIGQQFSLIETALALSRGMKRNGNDRVELAFAKPFVIERPHQPARDQMAQMDLAPVFEIENDVSNNAACAISRNRGFEIQSAMRAVSAGKCGRDRAVEWQNRSRRTAA